jgi:hypothetical protein
MMSNSLDTLIDPQAIASSCSTYVYKSAAIMPSVEVYRMPGKLMEYFNNPARIGSLSTTDKSGKVDAAVFGSPRMVDEKTVVMGLGMNRTLANLKENPNAVFLIVSPGKSFMDWKGIRVYLKVKTLATSGEPLENFKRQMAAVAGKEAADMVQAVVTFEITDIRPLIDMGQGWEKSI